MNVVALGFLLQICRALFNFFLHTRSSFLFAAVTGSGDSAGPCWFPFPCQRLTWGSWIRPRWAVALVWRCCSPRGKSLSHPGIEPWQRLWNPFDLRERICLKPNLLYLQKDSGEEAQFFIYGIEVVFLDSSLWAFLYSSPCLSEAATQGRRQSVV